MNDCVSTKYSSRVCERGTKGCNFEHDLYELMNKNTTIYSTHPNSLEFDEVNDFVHSPDCEFEELQNLCLGLAGELEKLKNNKFNENSVLPIDVVIGAGTFKKGVKFKLVVDRLIRELKRAA